MAYLYATQKLETSITCTVQDVSNDGWGDRLKKIIWQYYEYGSSVLACSGTSFLSPGQSSGGSFTATNLKPGTKYTINAYISISYGSSWIQWNDGRPVIGIATTAIGKFNWTYAGIVNGSPVLGANKVSGYGFYITALEWNALVSNVSAKLINRNMYSESKYKLNSATVKSGDLFTAAKFNLVRFAIGSLNSTGLSDKKTGDPIKAADLNLLMDKINAVNTV